MAANQTIQFTISAVDKATATVNRISNTVSKMTRPYANLAKSVQRFSKASGLTEMGKRLDVVAKKASNAATSLTKMGAPLLALVGGGTLAGLAEMVVHWERIGAETERTSRLLGITAGQLTQMRSAATLMGVSADTMTSGFQGLADTLQDARWGRNQAAFGTLQALGIVLHNTKAGTIDVQDAMLDLADRIKTLQQRDPAAARNLARQLGVEQLLPVLIQGRAGMQAYEAEARRLRGDFTPQMAARAQAFALSLNRMSTAADGLKASIADSLAPVLGPLIDTFTEWIAKNRELISQRVASLVERIAKWLAAVDWDRFGQGVTNAINALIDFAQQAFDFIQAIGGWKAVIAGIVLAIAGPLISTIVQLGTVLVNLGALAWANPVIAAIGMIAFLSYEVYKHWAAIRKAMTKSAPTMAGEGVIGGLGDESDGLAEAMRETDKPKTGAKTLAPPGKPGIPGSGIIPGSDSDRFKAFMASLNQTVSAAAAPGVKADADGGLLMHVTNFADSQNQGGGSVGGAGTGAAGGAGVGAAVRAMARQYDFAGKEARYGLPKGVLSALAQQESGGNAGAISRAGARGLFQFMPATEREYGINALDPAQSADAAAKKMAGLMGRYHGNLASALSAYNWGEGNLERRGLANAPAETRNYAPSVMARMASLNAGENVASLNPSANASAQQASVTPVVHVHNQVHVARDGSVTVRTQTPSGLKISRPMETV